MPFLSEIWICIEINDKISESWGEDGHFSSQSDEFTTFWRKKIKDTQTNLFVYIYMAKLL